MLSIPVHVRSIGWIGGGCLVIVGHRGEGELDIRYQGPKIWNSVDESDKKLLDFQLKKKLKIHFIDSY